MTALGQSPHVEHDRGPVGIFVLRVWNESSDEAGLRIRIVSTHDAAGGEQRTQVTSSRAEATCTLRRWLEEFSVPGSAQRPVTER